jgi:hypothetical protein
MLKREASLAFPQLSWPKNEGVHRLFLEHALLVSEVMVRLELACRKDPSVHLLCADDLDIGPAVDSKCASFRWTVEIAKGETCTIVPDRVFGLEFDDRTSRENQIWFCLEADRGTMPIMRRKPDQSSIYRKLLAYEATWVQQMHRTLFGGPRFRVLTVTTNSDRLAGMLNVCAGLKRARGLFLFARADTLAEDILNMAWQTCTKKTASLLD